MQPVILIRGSNDIASAVTHRLFQNGYPVAIHDGPAPTTARRRMAFTDAVFDGRTELEGVLAVRIDDLSTLPTQLATREFVPVVVQDFSLLLKNLRPNILVDARMRKHQNPENQLGLAELTIGLGPNFIAGETVHLAVETGWGETLGKVITHGSTRPLQGEPRAIEGHTRDRYVYAPAAGIFTSEHEIDDVVTEGEQLAFIGSIALLAPISGRLRGVTRSGVWVPERAKVIEVDPRGKDAQVSGIGERPDRIAQGVLEAIRSRQREHG